MAQELDLTETALRRWVQQAAIDAGRGVTGALTTEEREELGRLRREIGRCGWSATFIAAEKAAFPVRLLCRVLQVSRAGFYA